MSRVIIGWNDGPRVKRRFRCGGIGTAAVVLAVALTTAARGQVVINEVVYDIGGTGNEVREYVELYNAGGSTVDIGNWMLKSTTLADGLEFFTDVIPSGTMLASGDFWVLGTAANVANVDQDLGTVAEPGLWPNASTLMELKDSSGTLIDALAWELNKGGGGNLTPGQVAETGPTAWWGNTQSYNNTFTRISLGRYLDGRDTNNNGRDFGVTPLTPGASNGLTQNANYAVPDVDALALNNFDPVPGMYGSFKQAIAIDPTVADAAFNETAIPASPQGGKAILAWDEAGGGNADYSTDLVTQFDIYAYIDTTPYGVGGAESTTYGIGTTGSLHNLPDPTGLFFGDVNTANGNTGIGWVIQKEDSASINRVMLIDFNDGGPSNPSSADWTVLETIDMGSEPSDWYRLAIDYDPTTGDITAVFDDQTFNHSTVTDLLGTFYVGYRESLAGSPANLRPPTFDLFVAVPPGLPGDYNENGTVDAADYTVWRDLLGQNVTLPNEDPNTTPGMVTQDDYDFWKSQFGMMLGSGSGALGNSAVPEPSSWLLLIAALGGMLTGRWHK